MCKTNIDNIERLQALRGGSGYEKFSDTLGDNGINVSYVYAYMEKGVKPSKKTENGREARKALGIETVGLCYTRERRQTLNQYAREKGFTSWSAVGTFINNGGDPLKDLFTDKKQQENVCEIHA